MIGLVIVAHGELAGALLAATEHVVGPQEGTRSIAIGPQPAHGSGSASAFSISSPSSGNLLESSLPVRSAAMMEASFELTV